MTNENAEKARLMQKDGDIKKKMAYAKADAEKAKAYLYTIRLLSYKV